jgi:hypothetical protein
MLTIDLHRAQSLCLSEQIASHSDLCDFCSEVSGLCVPFCLLLHPQMRGVREFLGDLVHRDLRTNFILQSFGNSRSSCRSVIKFDFECNRWPDFDFVQDRLMLLDRKQMRSASQSRTSHTLLELGCKLFFLQFRVELSLCCSLNCFLIVSLSLLLTLFKSLSMSRSCGKQLFV